MNSDRLLSNLTRKFSGVKGFWRFTERIRGLYTFADDPDISRRLVTIDDYDGDLKLRLDKGSYMGSCIYWHGYYSLDELIVLRKILKKDMTFIDVGANNGYFTLFAAKRVPAGKVISFEPVESVYENLLFNIKLNNFKNITTYNLGLSDGTKDELDIFTSDDDFYDALSTLYPSSERNKKIGTIKLSKLDKIAEDSALENIDVIKIDVEGAELGVLTGAQKVLANFKPVILIEINEEMYRSAGYSVKDLTDFLESFGYKFKIIGTRGRLTDIAPNDLPALCNVLCISEKH